MQKLAKDRHQLEYWLRHARTGVGLSQVASLSIFLYVLVEATRPNRGWNLLVSGLFFAVTPLVLALPLRRILQHRLGALFFYTWETLGVLGIATVALLDGGVTSPLILPLFFVLVHATMSYPPAGIVVTGVGIVGTYLAVGVLGADASPAYLFAGAMTIGTVTATCALHSNNHRTVYEMKAVLADRDGLTGCLNHRRFHERLAEESERAHRHSHPLALLMIDLDHFKAVNDTFGHPAGDAVLAQVGTALEGAARQSDVVGRVGGDEFAVLLPETTLDGAVEVAHRLAAHVARLELPHVTLSIGAGALSGPVDPARLFRRADTAVYAAKSQGRDCVVAIAEDPESR